MTVTFTRTTSHMSRFLYLHFLQLGMRWFFFFFGLFAAISVVNDFLFKTYSLMTPFSFVFALGGLFPKLYTQLVATFSIRNENPDSLKNTYTFTAKGIDTKSKHASAHFSWDAIQKVIQKSDMLLLYVSSKQAFVLPKEVFSEKEWSELLQLVSKHVHPKPIKKNKMRFVLIVILILFLISLYSIYADEIKYFLLIFLNITFGLKLQMG
jgi:hypothetical protein